MGDTNQRKLYNQQQRILLSRWRFGLDLGGFRMILGLEVAIGDFLAEWELNIPSHSLL